MNASERQILNVGNDIRTLQDDELCTVTGGVLDYEGRPVVTYSLVNAWPDVLTGVGSLLGTAMRGAITGASGAV
jgi:hypothetical protein